MYPKDLLDKFDLACGKLSEASQRLIVASGSSDEGKAFEELQAVRREYDAVTKLLDEFDA